MVLASPPFKSHVWPDRRLVLLGRPPDVPSAQAVSASEARGLGAGVPALVSKSVSGQP